ncbi:MAG: ABC transporter ATP-binding protein [Actinomycetota bacterium]|nr:ABC transporter ATP-binding protein [Actinomycetota bacterium]
MTRVPESNEPPAISLRGVAKRYGADRALEPTDLDVRDGEFFCLLGPSGCGKTTTLNLIGGFVEPTQGEIWIRGERVDRVPPHRRNVNTVFQSYALFPHMTVRDNVGFGLKMARVAKPAAVERVARALRLVGLEEFEGRYPGQLSGGQQQRVAVARALVNEPAVLLLDEPLGALDLKLRKRLQIELTQIQRDVGTTFVYVTHDQEEAMTMGDWIAVMNAGQVVQVGAPREVYERPRSRFVADFIGESNFLPIRVEDARTGALVLADGRPLPPATVPQNARSGSLMVRPEAIRLDADEPSGRALPATVDASSFVGSYTRVVVVCEGVDAPVTAALHGTDRSSEHELRPGTRVWVSWPREEAVVLEEEIPEQEENEQ